MDSSPVSTASSSDLYSNSDQADKEARPQSLASGLPPRQRSISLLDDPTSESMGSRNSYTSKTIQGNGDNTLNDPRGAGTSVNASPGSINGDVYHKRKREHDVDSGDYTQGHPSSLDWKEGLPQSNGILESKEQSRSIDGTESPVDIARKKRSRIVEHVSDMTAQDIHAFQSPLLPAELWQHVFCFVPPVFLGRLLRVNRAFNAYLTPGKTNEEVQPSHPSIVKPISAEAVWAASRKRFCPGLPKPLRGLQELEIWRLLRGRNCQICGESKVLSSAVNSESPWESGPGEKGVRVIWPFGIRCCGPCLQSCSEKEVTLLLSSNCPSFLLPALPFALISSSSHFIANSVLRSTPPPSTLQLTKHYYKPHVDDIRRQLDDARELGSASAEEWIKGLDRLGKERLHDATRWEQWEAKGGLKKVNLRPHLRAIATTGPATVVPNIMSTKDDAHSERSTPQSMPFSGRYPGEHGSPAPSLSTDSPYSTQNMTSSFSQAWITAVPFPDNMLQRHQVPFQQPRPERNIRDVNEAKAARRAEIERRCTALDPLLVPSVLSYMESFQAAIQISQPLTDHAWEVLKPRLLAQRAYAEKREQDRVQQSEILQAEYKQRRQQEVQLKETKYTFDREWDNVQAPIRNRVCELADEIIETRWSRGKSITKDTSPKFAADVLLYVRQRFYNDMAREDEAATAAGQMVKADPPNGAITRKLILENMKWLFDTKIKPLTEHFQKELFLCNGCDGNFKFYGFEGVIQHFAAKHTTSLSMGSVVVHWRAEWPEHPPFHPNPSVAKAAYYKIPTPVAISVQGPSFGDQVLATPYAGYEQNTEARTAPQVAYGLPQYSPKELQAPYTIPSAQAYPPSHLGPAGNPSASLRTSGFGANSPGPRNIYNTTSHGHNGIQPMFQGHNPQNYDSPLSVHTYPTAPRPQEQTMFRGLGPDFNMNVHGTGSVASRPAGFPAQGLPFNTSHYGSSHGAAAQVTDLYKLQLDDMAKHARDVWFGTSGIKDIPQSVRIFVVIQQMASRFATRFTNGPSLAMFIDGIDHSAVMRPVRSLNGLACKTCVNNVTGTDPGYNLHAPPPTGERRLYTLPHLLNHFRTAHAESVQISMDQSLGQEIPRLDWKHDMIELPETSLIAGLISAPGMDDGKLELISWAFPGVFPNPLPRVGTAVTAGPVPIYRGDFNPGLAPYQHAAANPLPGFPLVVKDRNNDQLFERPLSALRPLSQPTRLSEPPGDDEYDPHRPAYLGKIVPGLRPTHFQENARPSPLRNGRQSGLRIRQDQPPYLTPALLETPRPTHSSASGQPTNSADQPTRTFDRPEHLRHSRSPNGPNNNLQLNGHFDEQKAALSIQEAYENMKRQGSTTGLDVKHLRMSEDGELGHQRSSSKFETRVGSPNEGAKAADQFLDDLGQVSNIGYRDGTIPSRHESTAGRPAPRWVDELQSRRPQKHVNEAAESRRWESPSANRQPQEEDDMSINRIRKVYSAPRNSSNPSSPHRTGANPQYTQNYQTLLHSQVPINGTRRDERSPEIFAPYEIPQQSAMRRHNMIENTTGDLRSRDGPAQMQQTSRYRSRSRSPRPMPSETAYYRARTPVEEPRHEQVYQVRSPTLRKDVRPRRVSSYEYPEQDRYEYIGGREVAENEYQQRVEYVPIRMGEQVSSERSRYAIAQPRDTYIRLEGSYGEPVYQRSSPVYHEDPRIYQAQGNRDVPAFAQGYRYQ